jgi:hypothetical protein
MMNSLALKNPRTYSMGDRDCSVTLILIWKNETIKWAMTLHPTVNLATLNFSSKSPSSPQSTTMPMIP